MAEKNNAKCSICGKDYYMCLSCKDTISVNPWKRHACTAEHYKVFQVVRGLSTGVYTKGEAKNKLKNIDLSDLNSYRPHIKKIIKDILKEEVVETVAVVEDVKPVEEPVAVETVEQDTLTIEKIEEAPKFYKKNFKINSEVVKVK